MKLCFHLPTGFAEIPENAPLGSCPPCLHKTFGYRSWSNQVLIRNMRNLSTHRTSSTDLRNVLQLGTFNGTLFESVVHEIIRNEHSLLLPTKALDMAGTATLGELKISCNNHQTVEEIEVPVTDNQNQLFGEFVTNTT